MTEVIDNLENRGLTGAVWEVFFIRHWMEHDEKSAFRSWSLGGEELHCMQHKNSFTRGNSRVHCTVVCMG